MHDPPPRARKEFGSRTKSISSLASPPRPSKRSEAGKLYIFFKGLSRFFRVCCPKTQHELCVWRVCKLVYVCVCTLLREQAEVNALFEKRREMELAYMENKQKRRACRTLQCIARAKKNSCTTSRLLATVGSIVVSIVRQNTRKRRSLWLTG